jgi:hydroxyacylglutathione hydrolase
MLAILPIILGPAATNTYLIAASDTGDAVVIDPAGDGHLIAVEARQRKWQIGQVWITHAHFDHIGGAADLAHDLDNVPIIALHPNDRLLWDNQGGAAHFGFILPPNPTPNLELVHGMCLHLGNLPFEVRHAPGHTPGLCIFYCAQEAVCFCGDLIFRDSVGRTDLPGGDWEMLVNSLRSQVLTLPEKTRLLSGHGPETTVGREKQYNPFLRAWG